MKPTTKIISDSQLYRVNLAQDLGILRANREHRPPPPLRPRGHDAGRVKCGLERPLQDFVLDYRIYGIFLIMGTLNCGNYGVFLIMGTLNCGNYGTSLIGVPRSYVGVIGWKKG